MKRRYERMIVTVRDGIGSWRSVIGLKDRYGLVNIERDQLVFQPTGERRVKDDTAEKRFQSELFYADPITAAELIKAIQ